MPVKCRLNKHEWELKEATFSSSVVCSACGKPQDPVAHELYEFELDRWAYAESLGLGYAGSVVLVMRAMAEHIQPGSGLYQH
jgi:hypothetical protein